MTYRILHVLGSAQRETTGIARIVATLVTSLDPAQYASAVIFLDRPGPQQQRFADLNVPAHIVRWRHPYRDPFGFFFFRRFLHNNRYDLVHFHWGGDRLQRLARTRSKVIVHLHGRINESQGMALATVPTAHADAVIATCHAAAVQSTHPVTRVIYPGIIGSAARHQPPAKTTLGFAARLVRLKGAHVLLQAVRLLSAEFPQLRLEIAGAGPEAQNLQRLAQSLGIGSSVRFLGWVENVEDCFNNWDIFVQASFEEGLGVSLLQAMSAGMPVVATSVGGEREAVDDGISGFLAPPGNPLALADAIRRLLLSPQKRHSLGAAARLRIQDRFSPDSMAAKVSELYSEVLNSRS